MKPDCAAFHFKRGLAKKAAGDLDGCAVLITTRPSRSSWSLLTAYFNRGIARKAKGDFDGAIADYDKYIGLKPDDADAYNNRGYAKEAKGDHDGRHRGLR